MGETASSVVPLRVLIADDHPLIIAGVRRALERGEGIEVVGEAHTIQELEALVERRAPEVVLVDLRMPGVAGAEHIARLRDQHPEVKVVVLSGSEDRPSIDMALDAGASAFVVKRASPSDVAAVLRQVASGAVFHALTRPPGFRAEVGVEREPGAELTERERAILAAAAQGLTTAQIANELICSEHTVKFHLGNIYRKLGVCNRAAAVRWAIQHGFGG
jgi:DNA-binding NarL/FixJ family response regulator